MKKITFIMSLTKIELKEVDFWKKFYFETINFIDFHFIFDGVPIPENFSWVKNEDLFVNKTNRGKFLTIFNHIKSGKVKTKFFKTVDPDDVISVNDLLSFEVPDFKAILKMKIIMSNNYLYQNQGKLKEDLELGNLSTRIPISFGTSTTILPTESVYLFEDYKFQTKILRCEDQLFASIAYKDCKRVLQYYEGWYIYLPVNGVSTKTDLDNYINLLTAAKVAIEILGDDIVTMPTEWPWNDIVHTRKSVFNKETPQIIEELFLQIKELSRGILLKNEKKLFGNNIKKYLELIINE